MQRIMEYTNVHDFEDENDLYDQGWPEPAYAHDGDAGIDVVSMDDAVIEPGRAATVGTGCAFAIPAGCVGLLVPRSGLARDHGITMTNSPGIIDSIYRGEVRAILQNCGSRPFEVKAGDRIGQLVVVPYVRCKLVKVDMLDDTERGADGFGSTGVRG